MTTPVEQRPQYGAFTSSTETLIAGLVIDANVAVTLVVPLARPCATPASGPNETIVGFVLTQVTCEVMSAVVESAYEPIAVS